MDIIFNKKQIFFLLRDFHEMTGLRVGVYDCGFREVAAYPVRHSGFCKIIRAQKKGLERCRQCDRTAFQHAKSDGSAFVYRCHAGLTEAAAPIISHDDTLGYLMFGQMRGDAGVPLQWQETCDSLALLGIDAAFLESAFYSLPVAKIEKIQACARVLQACAVSVWLGDCIRMQCEELPKKLEHYILEHIDAPLSLEILTAALDVGKTTLCGCVKERFGMTVGALIRKRRIEKAQALLEQTDLPISAIAERTGIPDYNYFTKVFRNETGITPTGYRKQLYEPTLD